jgi:hypothetical protein
LPHFGATVVDERRRPRDAARPMSARFPEASILDDWWLMPPAVA